MMLSAIWKSFFWVKNQILINTNSMYFL